MNKTMKKLLSFCMSLAMLIGSAVTFTVNAAVSGDFNFKFIFHDVDNNDKVISEKNLTVNGTEGEQVIADVSSIMPTGYVVDGNYTQSTKISVTPYFDGPNVQEVYVKKEVQPTTLNITFETVYGEVVGTKTVSTTATGADGEAWTFMLGTDYELPEGYQLSTEKESVTNIQVPFGSTGGSVVFVEPIKGKEVKTTLNITFETVYGEVVGTKTVSTTATGADGEAWTFMLGTDYELPEGYQLSTEKESVTNIQVPFGSTGGSVVFVEKINKEEPVTPTVATITFETADGEVVGTTTVSTTAVGGEGEAWTFMLGEDYQLPEGYKLAEGVEQTTNVTIPFGAMGGHTLIVEKINKEEPVKETTLYVTFETVNGEVVDKIKLTTTATGADGEAWTFMLGTDYELPEGYQLSTEKESVTNIQVPFGSTGGSVVFVEKINKEEPVTPTVATITFETADGEVVGTTTVSTTAVGGEGEAWTFMLGEDYQLPEGYKLAEGVEQTTNVTIPFGAMGGHTLIVEKINKEEPVTPVDPEEPVNPTDPEKPGTDDTKKEETKSDESIKTEVKDDKANTSNKKEETKAKEDKKSPKTGDNTQVAGYAVTLVACIALIAYYFKKMVVSK